MFIHDKDYHNRISGFVISKNGDTRTCFNLVVRVFGKNHMLSQACTDSIPSVSVLRRLVYRNMYVACFARHILMVCSLCPVINGLLKPVPICDHVVYDGTYNYMYIAHLKVYRA